METKRIKMNKPKYKKGILYIRSKSEKVVYFFVFIFFCLYALSLILPFAWLIMSSFKSGIEFADDLSLGGNAFALPDKLMFSNYINAFNKLNYLGVSFWGMLQNSLLYVAAVSIGSILFPTILAYCLSKYTFRAKNLIYAIGIFTMTIPIIGTLGASYKLILALNLYDSRFYYLLTMINSFGFNFLLLYAFFQNMSWSYAEAVFVDGGGHFKAFFNVMLPQARAPMLILGIMAAIGGWNDYMTMILYMPSYPTIASGLYFVADALQRQNNMPIYYSSLVLSMIPIIIIFIIFAEKMMQNMSIGGLKG